MDNYGYPINPSLNTSVLNDSSRENCVFEKDLISGETDGEHVTGTTIRSEIQQRDSDNTNQFDSTNENSRQGRRNFGDTSTTNNTDCFPPKPYLFQDEMKFMMNFNPNERLAKKKMKKFTEYGAVAERCDCLHPKCTGCHFPCPSCNSRLCGGTCRNERHWNYETVVIQGKGIIRTRSDNE